MIHCRYICSILDILYFVVTLLSCILYICYSLFQMRKKHTQDVLKELIDAWSSITVFVQEEQDARGPTDHGVQYALYPVSSLKKIHLDLNTCGHIWVTCRTSLHREENWQHNLLYLAEYCTLKILLGVTILLFLLILLTFLSSDLLHLADITET